MFDFSSPHLRLLVSLSSGGTAHLALAGEIDAATEDALEAVVAQVTAAGGDVAVDLLGVTYGGSTLAAFLARLHRTLGPGKSLTLCRPPPPVQRILTLLGITAPAKVEYALPAGWDLPPAMLQAGAAGDGQADLQQTRFVRHTGDHDGEPGEVVDLSPLYAED